MTGKKYQQYKVKITYLNGDTETINYENYNESSYKEMLSAYKDTKEKFKDDCVTIDFLGISEDGQVGVLFQKQLVNKDELEIKKEADEVENTSIEVLFIKLKTVATMINNKKLRALEKYNISNKKENLILHKIESAKDKNEISSTDKDYYVDNLYDIRKERRKEKNISQIIQQFQKKQDMDELKNNIEYILTQIKKLETMEDNIEFLTDEKVEKFKIIKEIPYKNFKERINLVKQLVSKYNKVYYDDSKMIVTCYNKSH